MFMVGCSGINVEKRLETVIDRSYIPKECPTFTHQLSIDGKKYMNENESLETTVIVSLSTLVESLERNKLARQTFNDGITKSNEPLIVPGVPETSNFKRVEKRIFVNRDCPKYIYKPQIPAKKLLPNFTPDVDTTYVVITLDEMVTELERNKLARETYNSNIDEINEKSFVENMKAKFDTAIEVTIEKIDDTAAAIKQAAFDKTKDVVVDVAKDKVFGDKE